MYSFQVQCIHLEAHGFFVTLLIIFTHLYFPSP